MAENNTHHNNLTADELWLQYEPYVRKLCQFRLQAYPDYIDDCISDTFLVLIEAIKNGKEISNPKAFLYSVAANKTVDVFRDVTKSIRTVSSLSNENDIAYHIDYENLDLDTEMLISAKEKVLSSLNEKDRKLLKQKYSDNYTIPQLAQLHHTSENNIYQKLFRLRKKTHKIIKDLLNNI